MAGLTYIKGGNLTSPLVVKALYKKWPQVKDQYLVWKNLTQEGYHLEEEVSEVSHASKYQYHFPNPDIRLFGLGNVQLVGVEGDNENENLLVANMIGQEGVSPNHAGVPPVRYVAFQTAFSLLKEIAEANTLKPAEANAMVKILEHFGAATKTGIRSDASTGKGKRPSEYSIASSCTINLSEAGVFSVDVPESEVYCAPETSEVKTEETEETEEA
jgi:hypothetical protein